MTALCEICNSSFPADRATICSTCRKAIKSSASMLSARKKYGVEQRRYSGSKNVPDLEKIKLKYKNGVPEGIVEHWITDIFRR